MIIAFATDDRSVLVFGSVAGAIAYCEGIDVEDGGWEFWNGAGDPLQATFSEPNQRSGNWVQSGTYTLEPAKSRGRPPLAAVLRDQVYLEPNPHFASVEALQLHLASGKSVTQHGA